MLLLLLLLSCPVHALRLSISRTLPVSTRRCTLSPLVLPRVLCPRFLFASFCGPSSIVLPTLGLLPLPLVGLFLLPLLTCFLLFTQYSCGCCFWGLFLLTFRFLLSWLRPLGHLPGGFQYFYLRLVQFSSRGFGWGPVVAAGAVRSLVVNIYLCISLCVRCCFFMLPYSAKSGVPMGGGGALLFFTGFASCEYSN